jgi:hypothetical protein
MLTDVFPMLLLGLRLFPECNGWKSRQSRETTVVVSSFVPFSASYCPCSNCFYFLWSVSLRL